jgi:hypothetical protein
MGGRGAVSGVTVVPLALYVYALVRGPLRHTGILWVGVVEQGAGALFVVFHASAGHLTTGAALLPLLVCLALTTLLLITLPRGNSAVP